MQNSRRGRCALCPVRRGGAALSAVSFVMPDLSEVRIAPIYHASPRNKTTKDMIHARQLSFICMTAAMNMHDSCDAFA